LDDAYAGGVMGIVLESGAGVITGVGVPMRRCGALLGSFEGVGVTLRQVVGPWFIER
jgi:hypothetical protein